MGFMYNFLFLSLNCSEDTTGGREGKKHLFLSVCYQLEVFCSTNAMETDLENKEISRLITRG